MRAFHHIFRTPLGALAALSVAALIGVSVYKTTSLFHMKNAAGTYAASSATSSVSASSGADWQQEMMLLGIAAPFDASATSTNDTIAMITPVVLSQLVGQYVGLQDSGAYSSDAIASAAQNIAPNVRAAVTYKTYAKADVKTTSDASYERMLTYRDDMRVALAPLLENSQAEYELFAYYVASGDKTYLEKMRSSGKNYARAADNASQVTVPAEAVSAHVDILNALEQYAEVVDQMASHADDAIASAALLRTYNAAEANIYDAFNKLATYERLKQK